MNLTPLEQADALQGVLQEQIDTLEAECEGGQPPEIAFRLHQLKVANSLMSSVCSCLALTAVSPNNILSGG